MSAANRPHVDAHAVEHAYDGAAAWFDGWRWQTFWDRNEIGLVEAASARFWNAHRMLDAGTGTGRYLRAFREKGLQSTGVDISKRMLAVAAAQVGSELPLVHADICALPFANASFDLAVTARTLSHVADLAMALGE